MTDYRCYLLDGPGAIRSVEVVAATDDRSALFEARKLLDEKPFYHGFELWHGDRRIHVELRAPV